MRAGLLRERVTILAMVEVNDALSYHTEYQPVYRNMPARLIHLRGEKRVEADEVVTDFTVQFEFRFYLKDKIKSTMRIVHGEDTYRILDINARRERQDVSVTCQIIEDTNN
jgi:head-tail adaptor